MDPYWRVYQNFQNDEGLVADTAKSIGSDHSNDVKTKGGIDLNPKNIHFKIHGQPVNLNLPLSDEQIKYFETTPIDGFLPIILDVIPITNVRPLLGIAEESPPLQKEVRHDPLRQPS